MSAYYDKDDDEFDQQNWGLAACVKFKGFGRPYNMDGGPLDWFERRGLPLGERMKDEVYYRGERKDGNRPWLGFGDHKCVFCRHTEEGSGVFG